MMNRDSRAYKLLLRAYIAVYRHSATLNELARRGIGQVLSTAKAIGETGATLTRRAKMGVVERLEPRTMLSISPVVVGNNVTFNGTSGDDVLYLSSSIGGDLTFSEDGSSFSSSLGGTSRSISSSLTITINLQGGTDSFVFDATAFTSSPVFNFVTAVENLTYRASNLHDDRLTVSRPAAGQIRIDADTDLDVTGDFQFTDPTRSLTIETQFNANAVASDEWVKIGNLGTLNADLIIDTGDNNKNTDGPDEVIFQNSIFLPGRQVRVEAESIKLDPLVEINTSASTAGNITLDGWHITLEDNAKLLAEGATPGRIDLTAVDNSTFFTPLVNYDQSDVDVTIKAGVRIKGGDVNIIATADTQNILETDSITTIPLFVANALSQAIEGLTQFGAGVSVSIAEADIDIANGAEITARNFIAHSSAKARAVTAPITFLIGPAVAVAKTNAHTKIAGKVTTTGDATVRSTTDHIVDSVSDTTSVIGVSASLAVSVTISDAIAEVTDDGHFIVGGNLFVRADNVDRNRTMARSISGQDGVAGIAIAVSVELGSTQALLDGKADVTGDVSVTADTRKEVIPVSKIFVIPATANGTSATSSVGTNSTGDVMDDAKASIIGTFAGPIKTVVLAKIAKLRGKDPNAAKSPEAPIDVAASIAFVLDNNTALARIGDGDVDGDNKNGDVEAGGKIDVKSRVTNMPDITANSSAKPNSNPPAGSKPTEFTGAFSVGVGIYNNDAQAYISEKAEVDAQRTLTVQADSLVDYTVKWGQEIVAGLNPPAANFTTDDGTQNVSIGQTVEVKDGFKGKGDAGTRYKYQGSTPTKSFNLSTADFTDTTQWLAMSAIADAAKGFTGGLANILNDNLGLNSGFATSWTQSRVEGSEELGVAGGITAVDFEHTADAQIKNGARINQNKATFRTLGLQHVKVEANSINEAVHLGGNIRLPGIQGSNTNIKSYKLDPVKPGYGSEAAAGDAAGFTAVFSRAASDVVAKIGDGVSLFAKSLEVDANSRTMSIGFGASGGSAKNVGFNGTFFVNIIENTTLAQIDNTAAVTVDNGTVSDPGASGKSVLVQATDDTYAIEIAGAVSTSETVGVGASVGLNYVDRDTQAVIGNLKSETATAGAAFSAGGSVTVDARNSGFIGAFAVAGAVVSKDPGEEPTSGTGMSKADGTSIDDATKLTNSEKGAEDSISKSKSVSGESASASDGAGKKTGKSGIAISGAVAVDTINDDARAYVKNTGAFTVTGGSLDLKALNDSNVGSLAGAVAIALGSPELKSTTGIAGAFGINVVDGTTEAFIDGATSVTAAGLTIDADRKGMIVSLVAGIAGATGRNGIAVAGSVAVTVGTYATAAGLRNTSATIGGGVSLTADDDTNVIVIAGSGGFGNKAGVGAAIAVTVLDNDTSAKIETVSSLKHTGTLDVLAGSDADIVAVTGSAGGGTQGGGGAGTVTINLIDNSIDAAITDTTTTTDSTGAINVKAIDDSAIFSFAGAFAGGKTLGLGVSLAVNDLDNEVTSKVERSTLRSDSIATIEANQTGENISVAVGGAGSTSLAIAGAFAVNLSSNTIDAHLSDNSSLTANAIAIKAENNADSVAVAGSGAGSKDAAFGAGVTANLMSDTITAVIDDSIADATGSSLSVIAKSDTTLVSVSVGGAGASTYAGGGGLSVNEIKDTIEAKVLNGADVDAQSDIVINASDNSTLVVVAGGGAGAGTAAVGAAVATAEVASAIKATVEGSTVTSDTGKVDVTAGFSPATTDADVSSIMIGTSGVSMPTPSGSQIVNVTVAGAGAGTFAGGAAISLNWIHNTVEATVKNSTVTADDDVTVAASDNPEIDSTAAAGAGASTVAIGAAINYNYIGGSPGNPSRSIPADETSQNVGAARALIENSTITSSTGDVNVLAVSTPTLIGLTVGGAGAGSVAVSGSIGINFIRNIVSAKVTTDSVVTAQNDVNVDASATPLLVGVAGNGGGAGVAAVAVASVTNDIQSQIHANIDDSRAVVGNDIIVNAEVKRPATLPQNTDLDASIDAQIWAFAVSGTGAGTGAGAGSIALNWIRNDVQAKISNVTNSDPNADEINAGGKIKVLAADTSTVNAIAGAVSGAGSAAVGASLANNFLGGDPDDPTATNNNSIIAAIENVTGTLVGDQVEVRAEYTGTVNNITVGGAGAGNFALGGAISTNFIRNSLDAHISGSTGGISSAGGGPDNDIIVAAEDDSTIRTLVGGVGLAFGGGAAVSVGLSVGANEVTNSTKAYVSNSKLTSAGGVDITADSTGLIQSLTIGGAVSGTAADGLAGSGAGAGSGNTVHLTTEAYVTGSTGDNGITANGGAVNIVATSEPEIQAVAGALAVSISGGSFASATASVGISMSVNDVENNVNAYVTGSRVNATGNEILIKAISDADIEALTLGGSVSGSGGGIVGLAGSGAGAGSGNDIENVIHAYVDGGSSVTTTTSGKITVHAEDTSTITADGGGVAVAVGVGGAGGAAASIGMALANNDIDNEIKAYVDGSTVTAAASDVEIKAISTATIDALGIGGAASISGGEGGGLSIAGAGAGAYNTINSSIEAIVQNSATVTTTTSGNINITATDESSIEADSIGASAAISGGTVAAGTISAAATNAENTIDNEIRAYSSASTLNSAGNLKIEAKSDSSIDALSVAATISTAIAPTSFAFSGAGASAVNEISNTVEAYVQGTSASARSTTTAAGNIEILANEITDTVSDIGSGALSIGVAGASIGLSLASDTIDSSIHAWAENANVTATNGGITIDATSDNTVDTKAVATSVAISLGGAGAGADAVATINPTVEANSGANATLSARGEVAVNAELTIDASPETYGIAGGLLAIGTATADVTANGTVKAHVDGTISNSGSVSITASADNDASATTFALAGGIVSGAGAAATTTVSPTVDAYALGDITSTKRAVSGLLPATTGVVTISAEATPKAESDAQGVSASLAAVGVSEATATSSPVVTAYVGGTGKTITAESLNVTASQIVPTGSHSADAYATGSAGGLLVGITATDATALNEGDVTAYVANSTTLVITADTSVEASNHTSQNAHGDSNTGGIVAVGATQSSATSDTNTTAYLGTGVQLTGGSLTVSAIGDDTNRSHTGAGAGGIGAGVSAIAETTTTSNTTAEIKDGATNRNINLNLRGTGLFEVTADHTANVNSSIAAYAGGLISGAGGTVHDSVTSVVEAKIGANTNITAKDITVQANNSVNKAALADGNVKGTTGGVVAGAGVDSDTDISLATNVTIGSSADLTATGTASNQGLHLIALNSMDVHDKVTFTAGGVGAGQRATSEIRATTYDTSITVGSSADLTSAGSVDISARGGGTALATVNAEAYGAGTIVQGNATVDVDPTNTITFAANAEVTAFGNLNVSAGTNANFERDAYMLEAVLDTFAGSAIPINLIDALADLDQNNSIVISTGAVLETARDAKFHAEREGFADMKAHAKGTNWTTAAAGGINAALGGGDSTVEQVKGTINVAALGTVENNGTIRTGIHRVQILTLNSWNPTTGVVTASAQSPGITFTSEFQVLESVLLGELEEAIKQLNDYAGSDTRLKQFYENEVTRLRNRMLAEGLLTRALDSNGNPVSVNGQPVYLPVEQYVMTAVINPIYAAAGSADIRADVLKGTGVFDNPGDAQVSITNNTPAFIKLMGVTIPESTGGLFINGVEVGSNSEIDTVTGAAASLTNFSNFVRGGAINPPSITVTNTFNPASITTAIYVGPSIYVDGPINNLGGGLTLLAPYGDVVYHAQVRAKNQNIVAGGTVFIEGLTDYPVSEPYSTWKNIATTAFNAGSITTDVSTAITNLLNGTTVNANTPASLLGDRIKIDAEYININGVVQSGIADYNITIGSAALAEINSILAPGSTRRGLILLESVSTKNYSVYFDTTNRRIEVADVRVSGGHIELKGKVMNTGAGELRVLGGYGNINVTNNSTYPVLVRRVDASLRGDGVLIIDDKALGVKKTWEKTADGVTVFTEGAATTTGTDYSTYQPKAGWRYGWAMGKVTKNVKTETHATSSWAGIDVLAADPATIVKTTVEVIGQPTLMDEGPYYFEGSTNDNYTYENLPSIVLSTAEPKEGRRWTTSTWYGEKTYYADIITETRNQLMSRHSIRADRPIGIRFIGSEQAAVNVTSNQGGNILIAGPILNPTGSTTLTTTGRIEQIGDTGSVGGRRVTLNAGQGIGTLQAVQTDVNADASGAGLEATSTLGEININEIVGSLPIDSVISTANDKVTISAQGSIIKATGSGDQGLVQGGSIELSSITGGIGATGTPLVVNTGANARDLFTASADDNINVQEQSGDLRVKSVTSATGDVRINVAAGNLIDANGIAQTDERTADELRGTVWADLQLTSGTGNATKVAQAITSFKRLKEQEYRSYWMFRSQQANPAVYDANFQVSLLAAEEDYYRNTLGYDDASITTLENQRTQQYHTLHARYGSLGNTFNSSYTYTLTTAEDAAIRGSIRVYTEDQLMFAIAAGLLKSTSDTTIDVEAPNVVGNNVTLIASGRVGNTSGVVEIDTTNKPVNLTLAQRTALAAAERDDVHFFNGTTEIFNPEDPNVTITKIVIDQREDFDITLGSTGKIDVTAGLDVFLGSEANINVNLIAAGDTVRVKGAEGIFNARTDNGANITGDNTVIEAANGPIGTQANVFRTDLTTNSTITARAADDVWLAEHNAAGNAGAMNVSSIFSESGDAHLSADGSIVDGMNNSFDKIQAQNIYLTAGSAIGETGDYLEINAGPSGVLNASAAGNIFLHETEGDMNIDQVESTSGDVDLRANLSILDAVDEANGISSRPDADVLGKSVSLTADLGAIGVALNDLDINSSRSADGVVTTSSALDTNLIETAGDLRINQVGAGADYTAFLASLTGSILNARSSGTNVTSGRAYLVARNDIGAQSKPLIAEVGNIEGESTTGSTWFENHGGLTVGGVVAGASGMTAGGSIHITTHSPIIVHENSTAVNEIIITATEESAAGDDITVKSGVTVQSTGSYVELRAGDNITIESGASILANTTVYIRGDYGDLDAGTGSTILINGSINAPEIEIYGGADNDSITIDIDHPTSSLTGHVVVKGGAGSDTITVNELHTRTNTVDLDGQAGADQYIINTRGSTTSYLINVLDTGSTGTDTLLINGTADADNFLMRAGSQAYPAGIAFVALLNGDPASVIERINYTKAVEELTLDTGDADDTVSLDDNWSLTTVRGGLGNDTFQVGQIFKSLRDAAAGVAPADVFDTIDTTRGYLSNGISFVTTIEGLAGNDTFTVFHNSAQLNLRGGDDDDTFVVRAFALEGSQTTSLAGEGGADNVDYVINSPVDVLGGDGYDRMRIVGTEFSDSIVVTSTGVFGVSISVTYGEIELLEVDAAEGNDIFYVLSTDANVETKLYGGLGSDRFLIGGDVPEIRQANGTVLFAGATGPKKLDAIAIKRLTIDGAAGAGSAGGLGDAVLLPGETNVLASVGTVQSYSGTGTGGSVDSMDVSAADLVAAGYANPSALVGKTIEISTGPGIGRFWLVQSAAIKQGDSSRWTLSLQNASVPAAEWGLPDTTSTFGVTNLSTNFFANETNQVDLISVRSEGSTANLTGTLSATELTGLGMGEGIAFTNTEVLELFLGSGSDNLTVTGTPTRSDGFQTVTTVNTGAGGDTINVSLTSGSGLFAADGEAGNDTINASASTRPLALFGGDGSDTITGGQAADTIFGDRGRIDYRNATGQLVTRLGLGLTERTVLQPGQVESTDANVPYLQTSGAVLPPSLVVTRSTANGAGDSIAGAGAADQILGGEGGDQIAGDGSAAATEGNDILIGDAGRITYTSGVVTDVRTIDTTGGADNIAGNGGNDLVLGGVGGDTLSGDNGNDSLLGDNGIATYSANGAAIVKLETSDPSQGGADQINGGAGNDIVLAGAGGDTVNAGDDNNVVLGDHGVVDFANGQVTKVVTTDSSVGGSDSITSGSGRDLVIGGAAGDSISSGDGHDLVLGDNASVDYMALDNDAALADIIALLEQTIGGSDTVVGGAGNDIIIGGAGGDNLAGGADNDLIFGDHAEIRGQIDGAALPMDSSVKPFTFTSVFTGSAEGAGSDTVHGDAGNDIILGGQLGDALYGDDGADDLTGGHNVAGGQDAGDSIDGGAGNDVIAGDNAVITRTGSAKNIRMQALAGSVIYDSANNPLNNGTAQNDPGGETQRSVQLLDHVASPTPGTSGADRIAGGADNDMIFGQLGNDVIEGDGSISINLTSPTAASVEDFAGVGRDGDDYIEGNGGDDRIYGNLGQDDLIGGSSDLFGLTDSMMRGDGADIIYGGAGNPIRLAMFDTGDMSLNGHSRDSDSIIGDNGRIIRLVGINGVGGNYLRFTYDYYGPLGIVPRVVVQLDYTTGGSSSDIGGNDTLLGEAGDDTIRGFKGEDVLFGGAQNDDLYGNSGHDRIYGNNGADGIVGDEGLIKTSRNGLTETLYGLLAPMGEVNYALPGPFTGFWGYIQGRIEKVFSSSAWDQGGNDVIYGGVGDDFIHAGAGDDAVSGAEATAAFYNTLSVTDTNPLKYNPTTRKFEKYDAANPLKKIANFLLNFDVAYTNGNKIEDGKDRIFGDNGNDWLVGGTGNDRVFGGAGDDLHNLDDNHDTNLGLNNQPDETKYADRDFAYGGDGLDVLIANTGGDRMFDWGGEFNSYIVPFSPFGNPTVVRSPSPQIQQFILDLGRESGADQSRLEPSGELGLFTQKDPQWGANHGSPRDPQPGNTSAARDTQGAPENDLGTRLPLIGYTATTATSEPTAAPLVVNTIDVTVASVFASTDPSYPTKYALFVGGTSAAETIVLAKGGTTASPTVKVTINGAARGEFALTGANAIGRFVIYGQAGNDTITINADLPAVAAVLYGGAGNDKLTSGAGIAMLDGGDGDDTLVGSAARQILVGGAGKDSINGGNGDDLLVAGAWLPSGDLDLVAAAMASWGSTTLTYAQRISAMRAGVALDSIALSAGFVAKFNSTTVLDDGVIDILTGDNDLDWMFFGGSDKADLKGNETKN